MPCVINAHVFGGVDTLPSTVKYIGRPGRWGNPYSSKSGKMTREEAIARHRVEFYHYLHQNPQLLIDLKADLSGYDLACWCKLPNRWVGCHGDTYLHILSEKNSTRDYKNSVLFYLMDDIREALTTLKVWAFDQEAENGYSHYITIYELQMEIRWLITMIRSWKDIPAEQVCFYVALITIELEYCIHEQKLDRKFYWLEHCIWQIHRMAYKGNNCDHEPIDPLTKKLKKPNKAPPSSTK